MVNKHGDVTSMIKRKDSCVQDTFVSASASRACHHQANRRNTMTREDIIRMAHEAKQPTECWLAYEVEFLERFATLVAATERKNVLSCWKITDSTSAQVTKMCSDT